MASLQVWLAFDSQIAYRTGSMLHCEWNPIRHPARSVSVAW